MVSPPLIWPSVPIQFFSFSPSQDQSYVHQSFHHLPSEISLCSLWFTFSIRCSLRKNHNLREYVPATRISTQTCGLGKDNRPRRLGPICRPVFTNVSAPHGTICSECHLMRTVLSTRRGINGRWNRDRSSERNVLVHHCCLVGSAFGGLAIPVPAALGIQELNQIGRASCRERV